MSLIRVARKSWLCWLSFAFIMAAIGFGLQQLEAKAPVNTASAMLLVTVDIAGLRFQVPAFLEARRDWKVARRMPLWASRRVLNRYGANLARMWLLPIALLLGLTALVVPYHPMPRAMDLYNLLSGLELLIYVLATEIAFTVLAYRDYHLLRDLDDPERQEALAARSRGEWLPPPNE